MKPSRPLRCWSSAQLAAIAAAMDSWREWHGEWMGAGATRVHAFNASDTGFSHLAWAPLPRGGGGLQWVPDEVRGRIAASLFGAPGADGGAAEAVVERVQQALMDWVGRFAAPEVSGEAVAAFEPWSGAVVAELTLGSDMVRLLIPVRTAESLVGPLPEVPATAALDRGIPVLQSQRARLTVELEGCDIPLGELRQLAVGDVLRLEHLLADPLAVRFGGDTVCGARLGRRGVHKAVALARARSESQRNTKESP